VQGAGRSQAGHQPSSPPPCNDHVGNETPSGSRPQHRRPSIPLCPSDAHLDSGPRILDNMFDVFNHGALEQALHYANHSALQRSMGATDAGIDLNLSGQGHGSGPRKIPVVGSDTERRLKFNRTFSHPHFSPYGHNPRSSTSNSFLGTTGKGKGKMKALELELDLDAHHQFGMEDRDPPALCTVLAEPSRRVSEPCSSVQLSQRSFKRRNTLPISLDTSSNNNSGSASTSSTSSFSSHSSNTDSDSSHDTSATSFVMDVDEVMYDQSPSLSTILPPSAVASKASKQFTGGHMSNPSKSATRSVPDILLETKSVTKAPSRPTSSHTKDLGKGRDPVKDELPPSTPRLHPLLVEQEKKRREKKKERERQQQAQASQQDSSSFIPRQSITTSTTTPEMLPQSQAQPSLTQFKAVKPLGMTRANNPPSKGTGFSSVATTKQSGPTATTPGPLRDINNGLPTRQKGFKTPFKTGAQAVSTSSAVATKTGTGHGAQVAIPKSKSEPKRREEGRRSSRDQDQDVTMADADDDGTKDADSSFDVSFGIDGEAMEDFLQQFD